MARFFKPRGVPLRDIEIVNLKDEEYEAIILADYKGLDQEEAARLMGISRPTFSRTLASARKAIAKVLAEGSALAIDGGDFARVGDQQSDTGETEMKIAFTTSGSDMAAPMDPRFGRAARFLICDTGTGDFVTIENAGVNAAQGAGLKAAETIVKAGATALVTGECGPKALNVLKQAGVNVFTAKAMSVFEALEDFRAGRLVEVTGA